MEAGTLAKNSASLHDPNVLVIAEQQPSMVAKVIRQAGITESLTVIDSPERALRYLCHEREFQSTLVPDVVVLNLSARQPAQNDHVPQIIEHLAVECIPTIVVAGSPTASLRKTYNLKENAFVTTPSELAAFLAFMKTCYEFWGVFLPAPAQA